MQNAGRESVTVVQSPRAVKRGGLGWKYRSGECMPGEGEKADVSGSSDRIQGAYGMSF